MKKFLLSLLVLALTASAFAQFDVKVKFVGDPAAPWVWGWDDAVNHEDATKTGNNYSGGNWPGVQLTVGPDADGYFTFSFPAGVDLATSSIIFSTGNPGIQTDNILVAAMEYFNVDLSVGAIDGAHASYTTGKVATALTSVSALASGVTVSGSSIIVANGSSIEIVNIGGVTVQSAASAGDFVSQPLSSGLYIVVVDGVATKVVVK